MAARIFVFAVLATAAAQFTRIKNEGGNIRVSTENDFTVETKEMDPVSILDAIRNVNQLQTEMESVNSTLGDLSESIDSNTDLISDTMGILSDVNESISTNFEDILRRLAIVENNTDIKFAAQEMKIKKLESMLDMMMSCSRKGLGSDGEKCTPVPMQVSDAPGSCNAGSIGTISLKDGIVFLCDGSKHAPINYKGSKFNPAEDCTEVYKNQVGTGINGDYYMKDGNTRYCVWNYGLAKEQSAPSCRALMLMYTEYIKVGQKKYWINGKEEDCCTKCKESWPKEIPVVGARGAKLVSWFQGSEYDTKTKAIKSVNPGDYYHIFNKGVEATIDTKAEARMVRGSGAIVSGGGKGSTKYKAVAGNSATRLQIGLDSGNPVVKRWWSMCSVTRYTGGRNNRIITGSRTNFLHGHWAGYPGVAYFDGWHIEPNRAKWSRNNVDYVVMCTSNVQAVNGGVSYLNGGVKSTQNRAINTRDHNQNLFVNGGPQWRETSNYAVGDILTWEGGLTRDEMSKAAKYLTDKMQGKV
eukprot:m.332310 g.332310  ORF g.332310 m.332310 type:complete len:525 (+) comp16923_c0_seq1:188-1762(+)